MTLSLPLRGNGFTLREFTQGDAAPLSDIEFNQEVKRFLAIPERSKEEWISAFSPDLVRGYAVEVAGELAGRGSLQRYASARKGYAELEIVIGHSFWGIGLGRRVGAALVDIAFRHKNAKGIVAVVHPGNTASIALLRALRFRRRGNVGTEVPEWQKGHYVYRLSRNVAQQ